MSLEDLARRAVDGDGQALSELCRALEPAVFRLCLRMLGDTRDAEDAAQDVLVKVVTHLSQFEGRSALSTWVHQIAARHVLGVRRGRWEHHALDEASFTALLEGGLEYGASQPPPTQEDALLLREVQLTCTQGMLMMLGREERLALVLVDLLGFDGAEAAEIVETRHDAFRQRLARARARLSRFLQQRCGVVSAAAACRCGEQLAAKRALGLSRETLRLAPLAEGDLPPPRDVALAQAELRAVRALATAFHRDGALGAPASLRRRMESLLPTLLR